MALEPTLMNRTRPQSSTRLPTWLIAVGCACMLMVGACQKAPSAAPGAGAPEKGAADTGGEPKDTDKDKDKPAGESEGVSLKPEDIEKAGIRISPAAQVQHAPETLGYAVVITRDALAQALADVSSAAAMARQSQAALARSRSLAGTPGAMPVEAQEAAERQAAVDHAALMLAQRKLSAAYGHNPPWRDDYSSPELNALASGAAKLARVTFPLGTLGSAVPPKLRLAHMGDAPGTRSFESSAVWSAPADATVPGRSFFAILRNSDVSEGERLIARVAVGAPESGILVPYDAVLVNGGRYWCYVEEKAGSFVRTELDPGAPMDGGYFVKEGIAAGARIVTSGASQLLAKQLGTAAAD